MHKGGRLKGKNHSNCLSRNVYVNAKSEIDAKVAVSTQKTSQHYDYDEGGQLIKQLNTKRGQNLPFAACSRS